MAKRELSPEEEAIERDVVSLLDAEKDLAAKESQLALNPEFKSYLEAQKELQARQSLIWDSVFNEMEAHDIKSLKGDWGSITVAERSSYNVESVDSLPKKYIKKVPDLKQIGDDYKLTGVLPKGVEERKTRYLMKRFK